MRGRSADTWGFGELDDGVDAASALPYSYPHRRARRKQRQENSFVRIHERRMIIQYNIGSTCTILGELARITHERFCYNRGFAAATSLRRAGSPLAPSTYCSSTPRGLAA